MVTPQVIEGDDFGFGEMTSDFEDMKKRDPVSGADVAI